MILSILLALSFSAQAQESAIYNPSISQDFSGSYQTQAIDQLGIKVDSILRGRPVLSSYITMQGSIAFTTNERGIVWADGSISTTANTTGSQGPPGPGETNTFTSSKTFTSNVLVIGSVTAGGFFGSGAGLDIASGTIVPQMFGARADCITPIDDYPAIQAAVNSCGKITNPVGGTRCNLHFPPGCYFMNGTVSITSNSFIDITGGGRFNTYLFSNRGSSGTIFIDAGNSTTTTSATQNNRGTINIRDIAIGSSSGPAVQFYRGGANFLLDNLFLFQAGANATAYLLLDGTSQNQYSNLIIDGSNTQLFDTPNGVFGPWHIGTYSNQVSHNIAIRSISNPNGSIVAGENFFVNIRASCEITGDGVSIINSTKSFTMNNQHFATSAIKAPSGKACFGVDGGDLYATDVYCEGCTGTNDFMSLKASSHEFIAVVTGGGGGDVRIDATVSSPQLGPSFVSMSNSQFGQLHITSAPYYLYGNSIDFNNGEPDGVGRLTDAAVLNWTNIRNGGIKIGETGKSNAFTAPVAQFEIANDAAGIYNAPMITINKRNGLTRKWSIGIDTDYKLKIADENTGNQVVNFSTNIGHQFYNFTSTGLGINQADPTTALYVGGSALITGPASMAVNNGNVGIGISSANAKLHVDGNIELLSAAGTARVISISSRSAAGASLRIESGKSTSANGGDLILKSGDATLASSGNAYLYAGSNASGYGDIIIGHNGTTTSGDVCIGCASAVNTLDVARGMAVGTSYAGVNTAPSNGMIVQGNVAIGATSPATTLHVQGNAQFGGGVRKSTFNANADLFMAAGSSITTSGYIWTNAPIDIISTGSFVVRTSSIVFNIGTTTSMWDSAGRLGLNTQTLGSARLAINGNLAFSSGTNRTISIPVRTSVGQGADLAISAGQGREDSVTSGNGGQLTLRGGAGGTSTSGFGAYGGAINVYGGDAGNGDGGAVNISGGAGANDSFPGAGGNVYVYGGIGDAGPGGDVEIAGGIPGSGYGNIRIGYRSDTLAVAGNVAIGGASHANLLDIYDGTAIGSYAGINAAPTGGLIVSGNVGFGTASPAAKLDVFGNAQFGSSVRRSTFTNSADLVMASGSSITMSGANGFFTGASSVTASAFFGNGSALTGIVEANTYTSSKTFTNQLKVSGHSNLAGGVTATSGTFNAILGTANTNIWVASFTAGGYNASIFGGSVGGGWPNGSYIYSGNKHGLFLATDLTTNYPSVHISSNQNVAIGPGSASQMLVPTTALSVYGINTSSTPMPSISCNAGTGVMGANSGSMSGEFSAGTAATACTVTFVTAWPKKPSCFCNSSTALAVSATMTTTSVTCTALSALTGLTINYGCLGVP